MLVTPSFDEISDDIKEGVYKVRVTAGVPGEYSTGTKYVKWTLETFGEAEAKNEGRKIWYSTPIEGKGAFMLKRLWDASTGGEEMPAQFDTEQLYGKEIEVIVAPNDRGYAEVKSVRAL